MGNMIFVMLHSALLLYCLTKGTMMKVAVFDIHDFEKDIFQEKNKLFHHELTFIESKLTPMTASLAVGFPCVCPFVNDKLSAETLTQLSQGGTKLIALRSAGFNHVDMIEAARTGLKVVRVPEYSPYAVAEHAVALIQTLNRKTHRAFNRVREGNFTLSGLVGFDLHGKKVGVIGTGRIGKVFARIMRGFGCDVLLNDISPDHEFAKETGTRYCELHDLYENSDIISLHCPLTEQTRHIINEDALRRMKKGVMLINTGRGALIETRDLIRNLKNGHIGSAGLDVYEEESGIFFQDFSGKILDDDVLARLMTFPNVLITSHQAFLTAEALGNIVETTLRNISEFETGKTLRNEVRIDG